MSPASIGDRAEQMLAEARSDLTHADQKASVLLAALGVGFGAVLGGQLSSGWSSSSLSGPGQIVWWLGVLAALLSVAASALAVWPRYSLKDRPKYGVAYWGHAAALASPEALQKAIADQSLTSIERASHQLWRVSRVVLIKYRLVRIALILGATAGLLLGVATIVVR